MFYVTILYYQMCQVYSRLDLPLCYQVPNCKIIRVTHLVQLCLALSSKSDLEYPD